MTTVKDLLLKICEQQPDHVALRHKLNGEWIEISYGELIGRVRQVSQILADLKLKPGSNVAIYLDNCWQWPEIYFGIVSVGLTAVPVDAKLHAQEVSHILHNSEAVAVFASAKTYPVLREIEDTTPALSAAVLINGDTVLPVASKHTPFQDYQAAMAAAEAAACSDACLFNTRDPAGTDTASIIYTSGTTGRQKGAMLSHQNFCTNVEAILQSIEVVPDDNFLLVLPLHHSFAFTTDLLLPLAAGSEISFVESLKTVGENAREVSPTILIGVPLLFEKMYARVWAGLKKKPLAYFLYRAGLRAPVIRGIQAKLGSKLRLAVAGGAPSDPDILRGFTALGVPTLEGYGLTETAPVLTLNPIDATRPGSVGKALPNVELHILEPNAHGIGEITAKGPNIMVGYYKNAEATAETFRDGWFLTGDMGFIDDDGYVTITGRKKSLIVNREGKNIYPEEVETQILKGELVLEAVVLGYTADGETGERVGAIVVPDKEALDARYKKPLNDEELTKLMVDQVRTATREIADYKRPRRVQVRTEEFEKTSTSKVKRYLYAITPTEV